MTNMGDSRRIRQQDNFYRPVLQLLKIRYRFFQTKRHLAQR